MLTGATNQFDGLTVRRVSVRFNPSLFAQIQADSIDQALVYDQALRGRQPMVVVARTVIRFATLSCSPELIGVRRGPLLPGEMAQL